jgi:hypothetical protein
MKIRFTGPTVVRRIVGPYEWSTETGFVQDVDADMAAQLLTDPSDRFVLDADEPLLALDGVGPQRAAELALAGIGGLSNLAELDKAGEKRLADAVWASAKQIRKWVSSARERLGIQVDQDDENTSEEVDDE